jgi:hypothetical protein
MASFAGCARVDCGVCLTSCNRVTPSQPFPRGTGPGCSAPSGLGGTLGNITRGVAPGWRIAPVQGWGEGVAWLLMRGSAGPAGTGGTWGRTNLPASLATLSQRDGVRPVWIRGGKEKVGGRGGIRTPGSLSTTPDFESGAFNHSATLPNRCQSTTCEAWESPELTQTDRRSDTV